MTQKTFVALAGNIGCGKTTAAKLISQRFGYELFDEPVLDNRFLKHYYADMRRWSFTLQLEFLIKRVAHHEIIDTVPKSCIQDRTLIEDPEILPNTSTDSDTCRTTSCSYISSTLSG